jgi:hypothetical protein
VNNEGKTKRRYGPKPHLNLVISLKNLCEKGGNLIVGGTKPINTIPKALVQIDNPELSLEGSQEDVDVSNKQSESRGFVGKGLFLDEFTRCEKDKRKVGVSKAETIQVKLVKNK